MPNLLEMNNSEFAELCRQYRVKLLELYGSAAREDFDPAHSDIDLLVEFLPLEPGEYADSYFGLLEGLETLFGRGVDLTMTSAVKNPYFLENIRSSRVSVYAD